MTGLGREIFVELAIDALEFVGIGRWFAAGGDVRPFSAVGRVEFEPLFESAFGVRKNCFCRTFRFAHAAIDALIRVDDEHILAFIEAVDRADFYAIHIFAFDAGISDDVGH